MIRGLGALILAALLTQVGRGAEILLICTGDTRGALVPCDCQFPGGLTKRATVMREAREAAAERGIPVLAVDLGHVMEGPLGEATVFDPLILRAMAALAYDAWVLGPDDLPVSEQTLVDVSGVIRALHLSTPWAEGDAWPTARFEREGLTVSILGWPRDQLDNVEDITGLAATASRESMVADLVILLSPLQDTLLREVLAGAHGIDVVVCRADHAQPLPHPEWEDGRIWTTLSGGEEVALLQASIGAPHEIESFSNTRRLLLADVEDDPEILAIAMAPEGAGAQLGTDDVGDALVPSGPASLVIEPEGLAWDEATQGDVIEGRLVLSNPGAEPLSLRNIRSTCRCVRVGEFERVIDAGGSLTVPVTIHTATRLGDVSESVIVTSRDRRNPVRTIPVHGRVERPSDD